MTDVSMNVFPHESLRHWRSHHVRPPILQMMSNIFFRVRSVEFNDGILIIHEILSHESRRIHRRSHEHSPKLLNALLQSLQRSTFISVFFALDLLLYSQIPLRHYR